jgi:hypothetical protein
MLQVAHGDTAQPFITTAAATATLFGPADADNIPDSLRLNLGYSINGEMATQLMPLMETSPIGEGLQQYTYSAISVMPSRGTYSFSVNACCLEPDFDNLDSTTPQALHLPALYTFTNPQFMGVNNGATFSTSFQQQALVGIPLATVLSANDTEEDSIALALYNPGMLEGDFSLPNEIDNGGAAEFSISSDGLLQWNTPTEAGKSYLLPVEVSEYRNGVELGVSIAYFRLSTTGATSSTVFDSDWAVAAYPNPTNGTLLISAPPTTRLSATLTNLQGQLLRRWENLQDGQQIDVGQTPGLYLLSFKDGKRTKTLKITVAGE